MSNCHKGTAEAAANANARPQMSRVTVNGTGTFLIATLPCGAELRGFGEHWAGEHLSRCRLGEGSRSVRKGWVVMCGRAGVKLKECPRVHELRESLCAEATVRAEEDDPGWVAFVDESDLRDGDRNASRVDGADNPSAVPSCGYVEHGRDAKAGPSADDFDNRGGRADDGGDRRDDAKHSFHDESVTDSFACGNGLMGIVLRYIFCFLIIGMLFATGILFAVTCVFIFRFVNGMNG